MFDTKTVSAQWGGKTLTLETGRVARQANGAVLATLGLTAATAKRRWDRAAHADAQATRRKVAVATWSAPREGRLMTRLVIDADPA